MVVMYVEKLYANILVTKELYVVWQYLQMDVYLCHVELIARKKPNQLLLLVL